MGNVDMAAAAVLGYLTAHKGIVVRIYHPDVSLAEVTPPVTTLASGMVGIKYVNRTATGEVDLSYPLSTLIAARHGDGVKVGMVLGRVTGVDDRRGIDTYRVIFDDGEGSLTDRQGIAQMRDLYLRTPGLVPVVVVVVAEESTVNHLRVITGILDLFNNRSERSVV